MEVRGIVKDGKVALPPSVRLPEGAKVRVIVDESQEGALPLEREALTWEDVESDLRIAKHLRFAK